MADKTLSRLDSATVAMPADDTSLWLKTAGLGQALTGGRGGGGLSPSWVHRGHGLVREARVMAGMLGRLLVMLN